jgi:hypothetical protein
VFPAATIARASSMHSAAVQDSIRDDWRRLAQGAIGISGRITHESVSSFRPGEQPILERKASN